MSKAWRVPPHELWNKAPALGDEHIVISGDAAINEERWSSNNADIALLQCR